MSQEVRDRAVTVGQSGQGWLCGGGRACPGHVREGRIRAGGVERGEHLGSGRVVTPVWSVEGCLSGKWRHVSRAEQGMNRMGRQEEESEFPSGGPQSRRVPRQAALGMNDSGRGRE